MKRILIALLALLWLIPLAQAVPAYPGTYKYKQPDGSVIILQNHGDEYYSWTTDAAGRTVEMDADGFYRPVDINSATHRARAARTRALSAKQMGYWSSYDDHPETNIGERKVLCILATFAPLKNSAGDVIFDGQYSLQNPRTHFTNMLNQEHYSENGAIGSVRDYYVENSLGLYKPEFDVYGPVQLTHDPTYYDKGEDGHYHVDLAIKEAYALIVEKYPDFRIDDYDTDNNGEVDMVLFYYPGHNEAEQAPSWTIWPHQGTDDYGMLGSKRFTRYFCTSELRGSEGVEPAAIGTTCHEFAHSLGLPDFYDVGKTTYGGEISSRDLTYVYDLMCYGNYNDAGRRPPYLTSLERNMLGWMPAPPTILSGGDYTLEGVHGNNAYRIDTEVPGEYFLLECRDGSGWDSGIANSGLVIYHVDQSDRIISGSTTASYLWSNTNNINSYYGHPCYYIVPSGASSSSGGHLVFPGEANKTSYAFEDWNGNPVNITLSGISFNGSLATFHFASDASIIIDGFVKDAYGQPLSGALVSLVHTAYEFAAPPLIPHDETCESEQNGYYSFTLPVTASLKQVVAVTKDGYVSAAANVTLMGRTNRQDFTMLLQGQEPPATLRKYDGNTGSMSYYGIGGPANLALATRYSAEELAAQGAVGATISEVSFLLQTENNQSVYVVVDIGGEKSLFQVVSGYTPGQYATVDISSANLTIPPGKDMYIGVGLDPNVEQTNPFRLYEMPEQNDGFYFMPEFLDNGATWYSGTMFGDTPLCVIVSATLARTATLDFASLDISYIQLVDGVPQAVPAAGKTVYAISWTLDGTAVNGNPPAVETLSAGAHTYMARLEFYDGTAERVYFDVTKE